MNTKVWALVIIKKATANKPEVRGKLFFDTLEECHRAVISLSRLGYVTTIYANVLKN